MFFSGEVRARLVQAPDHGERGLVLQQERGGGIDDPQPPAFEEIAERATAAIVAEVFERIHAPQHVDRFAGGVAERIAFDS